MHNNANQRLLNNNERILNQLIPVMQQLYCPRLMRSQASRPKWFFFEDLRRQAGNITVNALSDQVLRVIRSVIGNLQEMLTKLDSRYDSESTASMIAMMSTCLHGLQEYERNIALHVDRMAGPIQQLDGIGMTLDDSLSTSILVAPSEAQELLPATASIKTLSEDKIDWKDVANRLIEEANGSMSKQWVVCKGLRSYAVHVPDL